MEIGKPTYQRTRIAPTPSGFLHLGNVFSFALTAGLARRVGAEVLLRIDDLDQDRVDEAYIEDIFETLAFLEIPWDAGPRDAKEYRQAYSQTHRLAHYQDALARLRQTGLLYACDCSRSQIIARSGSTNYPGTCADRQLPLDTPDCNWRLRTDGHQEMTIRRWDGKEESHLLPASMQHAVVRKKNGMASYQLASVVDDMHFGIDLVVRGEDLFDSTLAQLYIAGSLGADRFLSTAFCHHGLLAAEDGGKLSKSAGATSVRYLRQAGMSAADVFGLAGRMAGLQEEVRSWAALADVAFGWR